METQAKGIYTLTDAALLVRVDARKIRRWLFGYSHQRATAWHKSRAFSPPLWQVEHGAQEGVEKVISFLDLLELRIVREFVMQGVPLSVVRHCLKTAKALFGQDHPLTRQRFLTDGSTIFHEALSAVQGEEEGDGPALLDLSKRQHVFRTIIQDALYAGIDHVGGKVLRWYPKPNDRSVVVDPQFQFGQPIVQSCGVPTAALYAAWLAESKNKDTVASLYEVDLQHVESAVRFETELRHAA